MQMEVDLARIARRYDRFLRHEAQGVSPLYSSYAAAVSAHEGILELLSELPFEKQQPNLLFAAVRYLYGTPATGDELVAVALDRREALLELMTLRRVQTNEPARCATILPLLAGLPAPLSIIEVGASAGLCLLPDHYGYDFDGRVVGPIGPDDGSPTFPCATDGPVPVPAAVPEIAWRLGIDTHPIDLDDAEERQWLQALVWPEQRDRATRLAQAIDVARRVRPDVIAGDLRTDTFELIASAPADTHVVVFHSAVLSYLPSRDDIDEFAAGMETSAATWISNEGPTVVTAIAERLTTEAPTGTFILAQDGRPRAFTGPHGQSLRWIGESPPGH